MPGVNINRLTKARDLAQYLVQQGFLTMDGEENITSNTKLGITCSVNPIVSLHSGAETGDYSFQIIFNPEPQHKAEVTERVNRLLNTNFSHEGEGRLRNGTTLFKVGCGRDGFFPAGKVAKNVDGKELEIDEIFVGFLFALDGKIDRDFGFSRSDGLKAYVEARAIRNNLGEIDRERAAQRLITNGELSRRLNLRTNISASLDSVINGMGDDPIHPQDERFNAIKRCLADGFRPIPDDRGRVIEYRGKSGAVYSNSLLSPIGVAREVPENYVFEELVQEGEEPGTKMYVCRSEVEDKVCQFSNRLDEALRGEDLIDKAVLQSYAENIKLTLEERQEYDKLQVRPNATSVAAASTEGAMPSASRRGGGVSRVR